MWQVRLGGLRLGRRCELYHCRLQLPGLAVSVDNLRLTSSVLSSEATNLLTFIATGVTFNKLALYK